MGEGEGGREVCALANGQIVDQRKEICSKTKNWELVYLRKLVKISSLRLKMKMEVALAQSVGVSVSGIVNA